MFTAGAKGKAFSAAASKLESIRQGKILFSSISWFCLNFM